MGIKLRFALGVSVLFIIVLMLTGCSGADDYGSKNNPIIVTALEGGNSAIFNGFTSRTNTYVKVTGLINKPGGYSVRLWWPPSTGDDLDLYLYDSTWMVLHDISTQSGTTAEFCVYTTDSSGNFYVKIVFISDGGSIGTYFNITVLPWS